MTAKEEISDWIASCAENGIPHLCKQRGLQKKFYYSHLMVDKPLGYSLSPLLLFLIMAPTRTTLKLRVLTLTFFRDSRKSEFSDRATVSLAVKGVAEFRVLLIAHLCQPEQ